MASKKKSKKANGQSNNSTTAQAKLQGASQTPPSPPEPSEATDAQDVQDAQDGADEVVLDPAAAALEAGLDESWTLDADESLPSTESPAAAPDAVASELGEDTEELPPANPDAPLSDEPLPAEDSIFGNAYADAPSDAEAVARSAEENRALRLELRPDGVAVVTFDVPGESQNTLRASFADEFEALVDVLADNLDIRGVVLISGKPDTFVAGADISMLKAAKTASDAEALSRRGQAAMQRLHDLPVPVVAAIHGPCLGGGLELALSCHARVCSDSTKTQLALPEVQLGLLPGSGGTQRLPRLVGLQAALDMMLTGRQIYPRRALAMGLVDEVVPRAVLLQAAVKRALALAENPSLPKKRAHVLSPKHIQQMLLEDNPLGRMILFQQARKQLHQKTLGNYPAPERIIDAVQAGIDQGHEAGYAFESRAFGQLVVSSEARALMQIFFATTALKKDSGVAQADIKPKPVHKVGMLGAGLMGSGIAIVTAARCKIPVRLRDRDDAGVARGLAEVKKYFDARVKRRIMSRSDASQQMALVSGTMDWSGIASCDVVIEAVFEDLALKHQMLAEVEARCSEHTVFASNTSSIPIGRIATAAKRPENVIGMHYFSPVEKMPLLEIIVTPQTSDEVTARCVALGKAQGKTVIVVRDGVGFYTSRVLAPYMNEAAQLLAEGVPVETIDRALKQWGFPVGPITLLDEVGIDVAAKVGPIMVEAFGDRMIPPEAFIKLIEDNRYGRKNKRGFYDYSGKHGKKKVVDASVYEVLGIRPGARLDPTVIAERCALQFVNEAALCLQEGILRSPRDGDIGAIFGLGFAPFRGGPFRYADAIGLAELVRRLERFHQNLGPRFKPAQVLVDMARERARFYQD